MDRLHNSSPGPRELYIQRCEESGCRKNSYLLRILPSSFKDLMNLGELDLNQNLVGKKGFWALLEIIREARELRRLCLANNGLEDASVKSLCPALKDHAYLVHMDLTGNPITRAGGKLLRRLALDRPHMQIVVKMTLIMPALQRQIEESYSGALPQINGNPRGGSGSGAPGSRVERLPFIASPGFASQGGRAASSQDFLVQRLQQIFTAMDHEDSGRISRDEVARLFRRSGLATPPGLLDSDDKMPLDVFVSYYASLGDPLRVVADVLSLRNEAVPASNEELLDLLPPEAAPLPPSDPVPDIVPPAPVEEPVEAKPPPAEEPTPVPAAVVEPESEPQAQPDAEAVPEVQSVPEPEPAPAVRPERHSQDEAVPRSRGPPPNYGPLLLELSRKSRWLELLVPEGTELPPLPESDEPEPVPFGLQTLFNCPEAARCPGLWMLAPAAKTKLSHLLLDPSCTYLPLLFSEEDMRALANANRGRLAGISEDVGLPEPDVLDVVHDMLDRGRYSTTMRLLIDGQDMSTLPSLALLAEPACVHPALSLVRSLEEEKPVPHLDTLLKEEDGEHYPVLRHLLLHAADGAEFGNLAELFNKDPVNPEFPVLNGLINLEAKGAFKNLDFLRTCTMEESAERRTGANLEKVLLDTQAPNIQFLREMLEEDITEHPSMLYPKVYELYLDAEPSACPSLAKIFYPAEDPYPALQFCLLNTQKSPEDYKFLQRLLQTGQEGEDSDDQLHQLKFIMGADPTKEFSYLPFLFDQRDDVEGAHVVSSLDAVTGTVVPPQNELCNVTYLIRSSSEEMKHLSRLLQGDVEEPYPALQYMVEVFPDSCEKIKKVMEPDDDAEEACSALAFLSTLGVEAQNLAFLLRPQDEDDETEALLPSLSFLTSLKKSKYLPQLLEPEANPSAFPSLEHLVSVVEKDMDQFPELAFLLRLDEAEADEFPSLSYLTLIGKNPTDNLGNLGVLDSLGFLMGEADADHLPYLAMIMGKEQRLFPHLLLLHSDNERLSLQYLLAACVGQELKYLPQIFEDAEDAVESRFPNLHYLGQYGSDKKLASFHLLLQEEELGGDYQAVIPFSPYNELLREMMPSSSALPLILPPAVAQDFDEEEITVSVEPPGPVWVPTLISLADPSECRFIHLMQPPPVKSKKGALYMLLPNAPDTLPPDCQHLMYLFSEETKHMLIPPRAEEDDLTFLELLSPADESGLGYSLPSIRFLFPRQETRRGPTVVSRNIAERCSFEMLLYALFEEIDTDMSGSVSQEEVESIIKVLGAVISAEVPPQAEGPMSFSSFCNWYESCGDPLGLHGDATDTLNVEGSFGSPVVALPFLEPSRFSHLASHIDDIKCCLVEQERAGAAASDLAKTIAEKIETQKDQITGADVENVSFAFSNGDSFLGVLEKGKLTQGVWDFKESAQKYEGTFGGNVFCGTGMWLNFKRPEDDLPEEVAHTLADLHRECLVEATKEIEEASAGSAGQEVATEQEQEEQELGCRSTFERQAFSMSIREVLQRKVQEITRRDRNIDQLVISAAEDSGDAKLVCQKLFDLRKTGCEAKVVSPDAKAEVVAAALRDEDCQREVQGVLEREKRSVDQVFRENFEYRRKCEASAREIHAKRAQQIKLKTLSVKKLLKHPSFVPPESWKSLCDTLGQEEAEPTEDSSVEVKDKARDDAAKEIFYHVQRLLVQESRKQSETAPESYDGEWAGGTFHGVGFFTTAHGDTFEGKWSKGKLQGEVKCTLVNGSYFKGQVCDGRLDGDGLMVYTNGDCFIGQFADGVPAGSGTYVFATGEEFNGHWVNGLPEGEGLFSAVDGKHFRVKCKAGMAAAELLLES
eukprot:NODE_9_length_5933_cov_14.875765_g7_i0.p1 GENE.NODE_9_length_5933_cov_14.875765_g7_i0~~NODE_9_length_5933_cov_14.875765_g7_i0.p1  ORF type:complete len:1823 (+),score=322.10 NODE_9_length_5933_cov_14.875765_g7_i0:179-5647(+)